MNDHCSDKGPVWRCKNCILMEPVMQVPSRGTNLQGAFQSATTPAPARQLDVQVDLRGVDWLHFKGERIVNSGLLTALAVLAAGMAFARLRAKVNFMNFWACALSNIDCTPWGLV